MTTAVYIFLAAHVVLACPIPIYVSSMILRRVTIGMWRVKNITPDELKKKYSEFRAKRQLTSVERLYGVRGQPLPPIIPQFGVADCLALERAWIVVAEHWKHELAAERVTE